MKVETDLVVEAACLSDASGAVGQLRGVVSHERLCCGVPLQEVRILTEEGAAAVGKPQGTYLTLSQVVSGERSDFCAAAEAVKSCLTQLLELQEEERVLVVGLGNRDITADALGPLAAERTLATRHLVQQLPESFGALRSVCALSVGVLGSTGLESGELTQALCKELRPAAVIAVDALAARSAQRLGTTIQISDSGITPGSGVGNARKTLSRETLGVPVIAVGVPTVIRAATLCADIGGAEEEQERLRSLVVTPKEIDRLVDDLSRILGIGITMALQEGMGPEEAEELLR